MRRLLASDLDGTLIIDHKIPHNNKIAIQNLKKNGGAFAISTGRPYNGIREIVEELNIDPDYFILNNGAIILDSQKNVLFEKHIPFEIVKNIAETYKSTGAVIAIETGFTTYIYGEEEAKKKSVFLSDIPNAFENLVFIDKLSEITEEDMKIITLVALSFQDEPIQKVEKIRQEVNNDFSEIVIAYRNTTFIDIVPAGCSKGQGVKVVGKLADIDMQNTFTIGDSWNDDSMFEVTKNSFTFPYAEKELQQKTTYVVKDVAECIDKYILINN